MSATLSLVRHEDGKLLLQGAGDRYSAQADFHLFDLDGEGGDPFRYPGSWEIVSGVAIAEYDPEASGLGGSDSFWDARQTVLDSARAVGIELPEYAD